MNEGEGESELIIGSSGSGVRWLRAIASKQGQPDLEKGDKGMKVGRLESK